MENFVSHLECRRQVGVRSLSAIVFRHIFQMELQRDKAVQPSIFRFVDPSLATTLADFEINNIAGGPLPEFGYNSDYAQRALAGARVAPSTLP
jgi:hypothetical protein